MHSSKINVQLVAKYLEKASISEVVISPGSRNSPLILEFSENPFFNCFSIIDERSAAYFALGKAQQTQQPVVVCCSSGSAVANYYPAVTEAFYQNVPLIFLTADRPEHLIDIFDGQTIRQNHLFEKHSFANTKLSESEEPSIIQENKNKIQEILDMVFIHKGPVHINMPFSEPLYSQQKEYSIDEVYYQRPTLKFESYDADAIKEQWDSYDKKMILCGILPPDKELQETIYQLAENENAIILSETTSNLHHSNIFSTIDGLVFSMTEEKFKDYAPEMVLTVGQNVVSKRIKQLLRSTQLKAHWHLDEYWEANTFLQLTQYFKQHKTEFLKHLISQNKSTAYFLDWKKLEENKSKQKSIKLKSYGFSDLKVFEFLNQHLPKNTALQLANSSAIRYSQLFHFNRNHQVFCNRGTSGIEGSIATALGAATESSTDTILITGDIGFFYECNSLWNNYRPKNFKIILINNHRGEIFNFIPGPKKIPEKDQFLTTTHKRIAKYICKEFDIQYFTANSTDSLETSFHEFIENPKSSLLEIDTSASHNSEILQDYFT